MSWERSSGRPVVLDRDRDAHGLLTIHLLRDVGGQPGNPAHEEEEAGGDRLLRLSRDHWRIENTCFPVKDDSFGEDRQVLQRHRAGTVLAALRSTAHALLRGTCPPWTPSAPMTARAEWVAAHPPPPSSSPSTNSVYEKALLVRVCAGIVGRQAAAQ